jgi:hypothetical protein
MGLTAELELQLAGIIRSCAHGSRFNNAGLCDGDRRATSFLLPLYLLNCLTDPMNPRFLAPLFVFHLMNKKLLRVGDKAPFLEAQSYDSFQEISVNSTWVSNV